MPAPRKKIAADLQEAKAAKAARGAEMNAEWIINTIRKYSYVVYNR